MSSAAATPNQPSPNSVEVMIAQQTFVIVGQLRELKVRLILLTQDNPMQPSIARHLKRELLSMAALVDGFVPRETEPSAPTVGVEGDNDLPL